MQHEQRGQHLTQKKRAHTKPHDDDPGHQALVVREPFCHGGDRRHIAKPDTRTADHPIPEIKELDNIQVQGEAGEYIAAREHEAAGHGQFTRAESRQHCAGPGRRDTQGENREAEGPGRFRERPAKLPDQQRLKETPRVNSSEAGLQERTQQGDHRPRHLFLLRHFQEPSTATTSELLSGADEPAVRVAQTLFGAPSRSNPTHRFQTIRAVLLQPAPPLKNRGRGGQAVQLHRRVPVVCRLLRRPGHARGQRRRREGRPGASPPG